MNNLDLVAYAKKALNEGWGYVWGTFGQVLTQDLLNQKLRQYPEAVGNYLDFIKANWMSRHVTDCVGLIKSCYWNSGYNASTDVSADGMYQRAKEKGLINTMPDIPGVCLHKDGHIGVYVGNGQVIEAHGTKYGVIQTPLKGGTPWTHWLKCPYIDYIVNVQDENNLKIKIEEVLDKMQIKDVQHVCNVLGIRDYEGKTLDEDNINGKRTESARQKLKEILSYIMK